MVEYLKKSRGFESRQVWVETSNGFFSVRNAYKLALELETNREIDSCSDGSNICHFWKRLWSMVGRSVFGRIAGYLPLPPIK